MATVSGDSSLNFSGQFDITQILANQDKVIQGFNEVKKSAETNLSNSSSNSSLSAEKQASLDKLNAIRDERLAILAANKERAESNALIAANRLAIQEQSIEQKKANDLLKEQASAQKQLSNQKKPTQISSSQSEVDAYDNSINGSKQLTSTLNEQDIAQARLANSATAVTAAINDQTSAKEKYNLTTTQSAKLLAEEKVIQANNTSQLKNSAKEQLNAKGSIEQRQAALVRLNNTYSKLSGDDRESASGQRLKSIIGGVTQQIKDLDPAAQQASKSVDTFTSTFTKGAKNAWSGLRLIANILPGIGIAGLLSFAIEPIIDYVKQLDIFKTSAENIVDLNALGSNEYKTAKSAVETLGVSVTEYHNGLIKGSELVNIYNDSIGKTTGALTTAGEVEDFYKEKSGDYVQAVLLRAQAQAALEEATNSAVEAQKRATDDSTLGDYVKAAGKDMLSALTTGVQGFSKFATIFTDADKERDDAAKKLNAKSQKSLDLFKKLKTESDEFSKDKGFDFTPEKDNKAYESALKQQRALQREIQDLINGSTKKQLSADDAEVQSVTDKYKKMRDKAIEFNNSTIAKKQGLKTDISGLKPAEIAEKQAIIDKQSNERFRANLSLQTKDFEDVENYRLKYGEDAAKERYTKEYNITSEAYDKQFSSAEVYAQKLEDIQNNILNKYGDPTGYSEAQKQELDIATKEIQSFAAKRKTIDDGIYDNAYQAALTNTQKLASIDEDYQRKKKALGDKATTEQLDNLTREKEDKIRAANEANADQKSGYATLLQNLDGMSRGKVIDELNREKDYWTKQYTDKLITAKKYTDEIAQLNGQIDSLTGNNIFNKIGESIKRYKDAKKAFDDKADGSSSIAVENAQKEMYSTIAEGAEAAATAVSGLGGIFDQLGIGGEKLQTVMKDVSGILSGAGEIAKGIASKDPVAIVTGSIKLLSSAIDLFNNKDKNLQAKIDGYKKQLDILGQAYKQLDRDVQNAVGNDIYSTQAAQIANLKDQQDQLIKIRDAESQKKKKDQGKIDDLNSQIDDIPNKIDDINKAISQELIQGTFQDLSNSLADALTNAFQAGADGIDALNQTFDDFIANAIKNSLKLALLEPITKQFTDELTKYAQGNGNSVLGFDFDAWKKKLDDAGQAFNDGLKESESLFKSPDTSAPVNTGTLTGAFATASQQSIDLLSGQTGGMRLAQLETNAILKPIGQSVVDFYNLAKDNFTIQLKIEANTNRTANNTDRLENIEVALVSIDKKMNSNSSYLAGTGR